MAIAVGVAACGGGSNGPGAPATTPASSPTVPSPGISVIGESPYSSPSEDTPEEKVNKLAEQYGWVPEGTNYDSADAMVQDVCDTLDAHKDPSLGSSPAQWLGQYGYTTTDQIVIGEGVPLLCPQWAKTVKQAFTGDYARQFDDGTWKVTSKPGDDHIPPGTYRVKGDLRDCYWERTRANGDIIDNQFATAASSITVTIRASDDTFTSRNCGTWQQVR